MSSKQRVTITVDKDLLDEIKSHVDGLRIRSTSEAINNFLKEYLDSKKVRTAVILAGGRPELLLFETKKPFRPLISVDENDYSLIETTIERCRIFGFTQIFIVGDGTILADIFAKIGDGSRYSTQIEYLEETKALGTAKTIELLKDKVTTDFLIIPCDSYFDFNLSDLFEFHQEQRAVCTLAIYSRTTYHTELAGIVEMRGPRIISHEEHPKNPRSHLVGTLIAVLSPEIFHRIIPGKVNYSLQEDIFPQLIQDRTLYGYLIAGNWVNLHSEHDLEHVRDLRKLIKQS